MGNIYSHDANQLHELLNRASDANGATLLIPDLQRPFVWTPKQVTLLIDSLIRGWPFGTLLLWKVNHKELPSIPFRPFWTVVDRTDGAEGAQVGQMNPPADYHMILDGQQRIQSLLLALGGDDWGFKLEDRDWTEDLKEQKPRGRRAKHQHWSKASLCFDLKLFLEEYAKQGNNLMAIDFRKVLCWAITDPQCGQSDFAKPANYEYPLQDVSAPGNQGRLIRLSRLWNETPPNAGLKEAQFRDIVRPILIQHEVEPEMIEQLLAPLGELMTTLRDVKRAEVTFLELQPFDSTIWKEDTYNDAIVNIFTRLNSAGRTLTREEITLAWLKVGWEPALTNGKSAGDCFIELGNALGENGLTLELDGLVSAASFMWSISDYDGRLLNDSDLLKGEITRPMASALSQRWGAIQKAFAGGSKVLSQRDLRYGLAGQFSSMYALDVLWAWLYVAEIWKADHPLRELERDNFDKLCDSSVSQYIDRWLLCSQWAGVWSGSGTTAVEAYAKRLTELMKNMKSCTDCSGAHKMWEEFFGTLVAELVPKAIEGVNTVSALARERVAIYRNYLWVWHRLDTDRWEKSQVQMRVGRKKATCEVDHIVSYSLWTDKLSTGYPTGITDEDEALSIANKLGNCALVEKNFNITKSSKSLKSFLLKIHEVIQKKIRIDAWCAALAISKTLLDPDATTVDEVKKSVESRDEEIRAELAEFVRGNVVRTDVETPQAVSGLSKDVMSIDGDENGGQEVQDDANDDVDEEHLDPSTFEASVDGEADTEGLRTAYTEDDSVRIMIDHFAERQKNQKVTGIDSFVHVLRRTGTPLKRLDVVRVFRSLDALGVGRFITGRKGYITRFEWHQKSLLLREQLKSEVAEVLQSKA